MQIGENQWKALEKHHHAQHFDRLVKTVLERLREVDRAALERYPANEQDAVVREALRAALNLGVDDMAQLVDWCHVRVASGVPFYRSPQFADILDNPLLNPYAKARHIALAFFAIQRMQTSSFEPWAR